MIRAFFNCKLAAFYIFSLLVWSASSNGNIVGSDLQNFAPITSGLDFVTVQSANTLEPGVFNLGVFVNYAVNTLPYFTALNGYPSNTFRDSLTGLDLNFGVGLMKGWDMGVSMPSVIGQSIDSDQPHGQFEQIGITEVRPNTKLRFLGDTENALAAVFSITFPLIQNSPFTGTPNNPIYNLELAGHVTIEKVVLGANLGYRIRQPGAAITSLGIAPFSSQYTASVAASYLFSSIDTKLIGEVFGAAPVQSTDYNTDRYESSLEGLIGLKHDLTTNLAIHAGGGAGIIRGNADPDWRVYAGVNFSFGPLFGSKPVQQIDAPPPTPITEADLTPAIDHNLPFDPFEGTPKLPIETFVVKDVLFRFNSDQLEADSKETLDKLSRYLNKPPVFNKLIISGHTDSVGSASYNLSLSQRRAEAVKTYLVKSDQVPAEKIEAKGYGLSLPIASNNNYQGRALNRRVEFKIYRDSLNVPDAKSIPNIDSSMKTIETSPPKETPKKIKRPILKSTEKVVAPKKKKQPKKPTPKKTLTKKKTTQALPAKLKKPSTETSDDKKDEVDDVVSKTSEKYRRPRKHISTDSN